MLPLYGKMYFLIKNLRAEQCAGDIEQRMREQPNVLTADVSYEASRAAITYRPRVFDLDRMLENLRGSGCELVPLANEKLHHMQWDQETRFLQLVVAWVFGIQCVHMFMNLVPWYQGANFGAWDVRVMQWWSLVFATALLFVGGWPFLRAGWDELSQGRVRINLPVALLALGLYVYSVVVIAMGRGWTLFGPLAVLTILATFGHYANQYMLLLSHEDTTKEEPLV
jgi:cation transport ATPase